MFGELASPLFVFDMANNHMGSLAHGLRIVREFAEAVEGSGFRCGFKLQYRQLDTFIHPAFQGNMAIPYVKRFRETHLTAAELLRLRTEMATEGFVTVCTPFDEGSVDLIEEHGFDVLKIASASVTDWPLLERAVKSQLPMIVSTAAATLDELDRVVSFLSHRGKEFALMHCVAQYPTADKDLQLNQIRLLQKRYKGIEVGFSTHEAPEEIDPVKLVIALGATILERHVGVPTNEWKLNAYSSTPEQVKAWMAAARSALDMCGAAEGRPTRDEAEVSTLRALRRGVFAKEGISAGGKVTLGATFLAIPTVEDQLTANDMGKYIDYVTLDAIEAGEPVLAANVTVADTRDQIYAIVQRVKAYLQENNIHVPGRLELEVSHHYGIDQFDEYGATIITFVNREYCKKLIVLLPGQRHPEQYHEVKEETFQILQGEIDLALEGEWHRYMPGDIVTVERSVKHEFLSENGGVIEEVSSMHIKEDSYYTDPAIALTPSRKTLISYWVE